MTPTAVPNGQDGLADVAVIGLALNNAVIFCHVSVHRWRGHKSVEDAVVKVAGADTTARAITTPRWKLLDDDWQKRFNQAEYLLRSIISTASPAFAIPGVYVIPRLRASELLRRVDQVANEQFWPLVNEFAAGWGDYVEGLRLQNTAAQWEQVQKALPRSAGALCAYFRA